MAGRVINRPYRPQIIPIHNFSSYDADIMFPTLCRFQMGNDDSGRDVRRDLEGKIWTGDERKKVRCVLTCYRVIVWESKSWHCILVAEELGMVGLRYV